MDEMKTEEFNKLIDERIKQIVPDYLQKSAFMDRKLTDTPSDDLQVTPRKYITRNGTTRPTSSVMGEHYFDTSLASGRGKDITWNGTGWVDGTGAYV